MSGTLGRIGRRSDGRTLLAAFLQEVMELLSELEHVHFVYVCRKKLFVAQETDDAAETGHEQGDSQGAADTVEQLVQPQAGGEAAADVGAATAAERNLEGGQSAAAHSAEASTSDSEAAGAVTPAPDEGEA